MENFEYFFNLLTTEAAIDDHFKVSEMPKNLQKFAFLDPRIVERVLKNGVTLDLGYLNLPDLKRGDFKILRKMLEARKAGFLLLPSEVFVNPLVDFKSPLAVQTFVSDSAAKQSTDLAITGRIQKERFETTSESSDEEPTYSPQSPARPFFCEICKLDFCKNYHLPLYEK